MSDEDFAELEAKVEALNFIVSGILFEHETEKLNHKSVAQVLLEIEAKDRAAVDGISNAAEKGVISPDRARRIAAHLKQVFDSVRTQFAAVHSSKDTPNG